MPERAEQKQQTSPCGQTRPQWDVVGRVNDLINCYLITAGQAFSSFLPNVLIGLVLIVIMFLALRELVKD